MTRYQSSKVRRPPDDNLSPTGIVIFRTNAQSSSSGKRDASNRECLMNKLILQEKEIKHLKTEMQKLQKYVQGVNLSGRALKETQEKNKELHYPNPSTIYTSSVVDDERNIDLKDVNTISPSDIETNPSLDTESEDSIAVLCDHENNGIKKFLLDQTDKTAMHEKSNKEERPLKCKQCGQQAIHEKYEGEIKLVGNRKDYYNDLGKMWQRDGKKTKEVSDIEEVDKQDVMLPSGSDKHKRNKETDDIPTFHDFPSTVDIHSDDCILTTNEKDQEESVESVKDEDTDYEQLCVSIGVDTKDLCWENDNKTIREENEVLKHQLGEITKVNSAWDKFWTGKETTFETILAEKEKIIASLKLSEADYKIKIETAAADKQRILKEKDEMLLLTKGRINKLETIIDQLRSDLAHDRQKNERTQKFARTLLKQKEDLEAEIKRLNQILETKVGDQNSSKPLDPSNGCTPNGQENTHQKPSCTEENTGDVKQKQTMSQDNKTKRETKAQEKLKEEPGTQVPEQKERQDLLRQQDQEENSQKSLSKEELKERMMFLKEHKDAYESDFKKERRDRENVVEQLQAMKQKLDETKQKLKRRKHVAYHQSPFPKGAERTKIPEQCVYIPVKVHCPDKKKTGTVVIHGIPEQRTRDKHHDCCAPQKSRARDRDVVCICNR